MRLRTNRVVHVFDDGAVDSGEQKQIIFFLLVLVALLTTAISVRAQNSGKNGTPAESKPGQSTISSYAMDKIENVNLANGNFSLAIPLTTIGGRGTASFNVTLAYNSKVWTSQADREPIYTGNGALGTPLTHYSAMYDKPTDYDEPGVSKLGGGWTIRTAPGLTARTIGIDHMPTSGCNTYTDDIKDCGFKYALTKMWLSLPDGSQVELRDALTEGAPAVTTNIQNGYHVLEDRDRGRIWHSFDGSNVVFVRDENDSIFPAVEFFFPSGWVFLADGTRMRIASGAASNMIDRNGNVVSLEGPYVDELGRQTSIEASASAVTVRISGYSGAPERTFTINLGQIGSNLRSDFVSLPRPFTTGDAYRDTQGNFFEHMIPTAHTDLFNQSEGIKAYGSYEGDDVGNRTAVTQLTLPDGRSLRFHYNQYGEVAELVYPGGGVSQIDYDGFGSTVCEANTPIRIGLNRRVKQRRSLADGGNVDAVWIYNRTTETINSVNYPAVTVEAHQGSPTGTLLASSEHIFYELDKEDRICGSPTVTGTGNEHWQNAKEFRTITTSESGTMTVEHEWQQRAAIIWANDVGLSYNTYQQEHGIYAAGNDPRLVREDTTIENGLVKRVTFDYDNLNNVIATNEYDFGASPGTIGNSIRQTVRTYGTTQSGNFGISLNGNCYSNLNPGDSTCGNGLATDVSSIIHQTNLLQNQTINEIVNGSPSQRAYSASEYDKYTSQPNAPPFGLNSGMVHYDGTQFSAYASANQPRGNVTRTSRWIGGSSYLDSYAQYDNAGNVIWSKDPKGYESSISYTDNFGDGSNPDSPGGGPNGVTFAFPTIVTNPLGHQATTQYNYTLGAPTAVKDPNGVIARTEYDAAGRPFRVTSAVGLSAQTISEMTYPTASSNVATTSRQLDASRWLASKTVMDGFDRSVTSWQAEDGHKADAASFTIESNTVYDALGRASQVTNPYRPNDLNDQPRSTTTQYDLAGRVKVVITPDSAQITTLYNGNEVTVTDQDGKQRRSVTDGLGRLRKVYEAPNGVNYLTSYDYDVQDDLTTVTQGGQTRTFVYDPLKRLMSATNPECGTVCYGTRDEHGCVADGYDANGNLIHKTDARGVLTTYDYDALNRVVSRTYSDGTPNVTYGYDATTVAYAKGRRTSVTSSISSYSYIEYDPVGQVKSARQTTDAVDYNMSYTYNLAGGMISQSYPSGRIVGTEFDNAGRIAGVENATTGAFYQGGASTDATNRLQYNAMGAVTAARLGNGLWEHAVFNARLQTTQIGLGTSSANSSVLQLDYGYGTTNNNGNLKSQTITLPDGTALTQTYSYDALNRLTSATEINGGTQTWKQGFKYEDDSGQYGQFGNRRIDAANTTASLITENPLFDPNTNRIQPQGGEHYHYDPAGNLDTDKVGNTFSYDADNKQKEYNGGWQNGGATYIYDGDGHRVKKLTGNTTTVFVYNILGELVAEYSDATSVGSGGTNYLTADNLGTPRVVTGQNSNVISRHDYLPFGEELGAGTGGRTTAQGYPTGPGADGVRQQFTQKERDNETGLDYFGARYFASAQGRFTSADPVFMNGERRFSPQDINLYAYCGNNPLTHIDPDGRYYVGTDGKKVKVTVDASGNVHVGKNANSSLKRYAQLVNQAGSGEAVSAMLQVANNATRVHFKISPEVEHTKEGNLLFGLHQAHDKNGKALDWDSVAGTFKGKAAFITGRDGGTEYKEATITIYEGSIKTEAGTNYLRAELGDPKLTTNEAIVTTGAHEDTHDIDKASIGAIKDRQEGKANPLNVEAPAEEVEKKTADEIRKNRKPE